MNLLTIIQIEWNSWNGFIFSLLSIEYGQFNRELLGLHFSRTHLIFSVLFIRFNVIDPFKYHED